MLELKTRFAPANGGDPKTITVRISDVRETKEGEWSAAIDVLGFRFNDNVRIPAADWAEAVELAARFIAQTVNNNIELEGGGTLDPPIYPIQKKLSATQ